MVTAGRQGKVTEGSLGSRPSKFTGAVIFEPRASDPDLVDVENALVRAAVGEYAVEAAVLLLANGGHWLPALQAAGLIDLEPDPAGGETWAQVRWDDVRGALQGGGVGRRRRSAAAATRP